MCARRATGEGTTGSRGLLPVLYCSDCSERPAIAVWSCFPSRLILKLDWHTLPRPSSVCACTGSPLSVVSVILPWPSSHRQLTAARALAFACEGEYRTAQANTTVWSTRVRAITHTRKDDRETEFSSRESLIRLVMVQPSLALPIPHPGPFAAPTNVLGTGDLVASDSRPPHCINHIAIHHRYRELNSPLARVSISVAAWLERTNGLDLHTSIFSYQKGGFHATSSIPKFADGCNLDSCKGGSPSTRYLWWARLGS